MKMVNEACEYTIEKAKIPHTNCIKKKIPRTKVSLIPILTNHFKESEKISQLIFLLDFLRASISSQVLIQPWQIINSNHQQAGNNKSIKTIERGTNRKKQTIKTDTQA